MSSCLLSQKGSLLGSPSLNEEPLPLLPLDERMPTQLAMVSQAHADCGLRTAALVSGAWPLECATHRALHSRDLGVEMSPSKALDNTAAVCQRQ